MAHNSIVRLLNRLDSARYHFGDTAGVIKILRLLAAARFNDPKLLIRFHEAVLFLRAFPPDTAILRAIEPILNNFHQHVRALREAHAEMEDFDTFEYSGIAGTEMEDTLSFDLARWLVKRLPGKVDIAWDNYEPGRELGTIGPRFMPLLEDDAYVEADTPWREWLEAAVKTRTKNGTAAWLIERFERMPLPPEEKAALYESLRIPLRWNLDNSVITRTRNWKPVRHVFYHNEPLISRSLVSLSEELRRRSPALKRLSRKRGGQIIDMIREVMLVRYRELYGTTLGDPSSVVRAEVGRGVEIYLWNLPPDRRLPLRAYVAGLTLKNGVPINYIEAIGLCEWMEVGFNTFYTFRGGEAGWVYAQILCCLCSLMGTTCISVYPYQLGHENDEAIESGAFWFYRKLGFRPGRADLQKLAEREEKKIVADNKYRTPARTLKRLAASHVFYELPGSEVGAWDKFSTRNIGLRVDRKMAQDFGGDAVLMRERSRRKLERMLGLNRAGSGTSSWTPLEQSALESLSLVLAQGTGLHVWTRKEKEDLVRIIRAKSKPDELLYLHLTQRHKTLRNALLALGS